MPQTIQVEVLYAPVPHQADLTTVTLPEESTVAEAIAAAGVLARHPEIDLEGQNKVGIFAKVVTLSTPLRDRDRVEIYRPITADPKAARRKRASKQEGEGS